MWFNGFAFDISRRWVSSLWQNFLLLIFLFTSFSLFGFFNSIAVATLYRSIRSSYLVSLQYRWSFNNWFLSVYQTCPLKSWTFMTGILLICLTRTNVNNGLSTCSYFLNPALSWISLLLPKLTLQLVKRQRGSHIQKSPLSCCPMCSIICISWIEVLFSARNSFFFFESQVKNFFGEKGEKYLLQRSPACCRAHLPLSGFWVVSGIPCYHAAVDITNVRFSPIIFTCIFISSKHSCVPILIAFAVIPSKYCFTFCTSN